MIKYGSKAYVIVIGAYRNRQIMLFMHEWQKGWRVRVSKCILPMLVLVIYSCLMSGCGKREEENNGIVAIDPGNLQLTEYDPEEVIQSALKQLGETDRECDVVSAAEVSQRKVSIVILGLAYSFQMEQICAMLKENDIPAMLIVDGMSAAEDSDTVKLFDREGFEIGNYTLQAERHMNEQSEEEIAASYAHAQTILKTITGKEAKYCAANATKMDSCVLHAAYAAGLEVAVEPSSYITDISFPTFSAAMGYVSGLKSGEIIAVKVGDSLDETEYEPFEQDMRPATDFDDALEEYDENTERNTDIVITVEYLLEALETTETAVVPLERLSLDFDELVDRMFKEAEDTYQYELPEHETVDASWFDNSLFIGDSLTLAMSIYSMGFPDTTAFCAYKSITPKQFVDNVIVNNEDGSRAAVFDEICDHDPDNIFILLGTNVMTTGTDTSLVAPYEMLIQKLQEQFPDADIYIQGLPSVTKKVSTERITITINRIKKINVQLAQLANDRRCYYIDLYHATAGEDGYLSTYIAQEDGIHLNQIGCEKWFDYLKTHVVIEEE